jgi:hypothetical protein
MNEPTKKECRMKGQHMTPMHRDACEVCNPPAPGAPCECTDVCAAKAAIGGRVCRESASADESTFVIELLVAAGFVTRGKVEEARSIAHSAGLASEPRDALRHLQPEMMADRFVDKLCMIQYISPQLREVIKARVTLLESIIGDALPVIESHIPSLSSQGTMISLRDRMRFAVQPGMAPEASALSQRVRDVIVADDFNQWTEKQGGYDLTRDDCTKGFGRTYRDDNTEHAWRGWAQGRCELVKRTAGE